MHLNLYNLKYNLPETKQRSGIFGFFCDISILVFIPRFLLEYLQMFCRTLAGQPRCVLSGCTRSLIKRYVRYLFYAYIVTSTVKGVVLVMQT
jgi:hypothetical protein